MRYRLELYDTSSVTFQRVISCVAAFWMQRNTTLSTGKSSFFLDIFWHKHTQHFRVGVLSFFVGGIWTSL